MTRFAAFGLALCLAISGCSVGKGGPGPADFHQVRLGMSVRDVERVLGGPGKEITRNDVPVLSGPPDGLDKWLKWEGDSGSLYAGFTNGRVVFVYSVARVSDPW